MPPVGASMHALVPDMLPRPEVGAGALGEAMRLLDLKSAVRLERFSGEARDWSEWKFRFQSVIELVQLGWYLERIEELKEEVVWSTLTPDECQKSALLYNILVQVMTGSALATIQLVEHANGFECWRRLLREFEPKEPARVAAMLAALTCPSWTGAVVGFEQELKTWELGVRRYEKLTGCRVAEQLLCAIVAKYAPPAVKAYLRIEAIAVFLRRGRTYAEDGDRDVAAGASST